MEIKPDSPQIQNNLAWVLATYTEASIRNGAEAVELAQRAVQHSHLARVSRSNYGFGRVFRDRENKKG